jgi:hypothetical protein
MKFLVTLDGPQNARVPQALENLEKRITAVCNNWLADNFGVHRGNVSVVALGESDVVTDADQLLRLQARASSRFDVKWLIWSIEHDAWWAQDSCGYTKDKDTAGRYDFGEAVDIVMSANTSCGRIRSKKNPEEALCPDWR